MYSSQQIADWFIALSRAKLRMEEDVEPITVGQLNLLMYFAQGVYFKWYGKQLFDDEFRIAEDEITEGSLLKELHSKYPKSASPIVFENVSDSRAIELAMNYECITRHDPETADLLSLAWYELKNDL